MNTGTIFLIILIILCPLSHLLLMRKKHKEDSNEKTKEKEKPSCH